VTKGNGRLQGFKAMNFRDLTYKINGAIYEVHRTLGEGFLEKVNENGQKIKLFYRPLVTSIDKVGRKMG
jgi:hypothetical protein